MTGLAILKKNHFTREEIEEIRSQAAYFDESRRSDVFDSEYESTQQFKDAWTNWLRAFGGTNVSPTDSLRGISAAMEEIYARCHNIDIDMAEEKQNNDCTHYVLSQKEWKA